MFKKAIVLHTLKYMYCTSTFVTGIRLSVVFFSHAAMDGRQPLKNITVNGQIMQESGMYHLIAC